MRIGHRHVLHGSVLIAVLVQLGFATAFLVDAAQTNRTYDALAAHHVALTGRVLGCAAVTTLRGSGTRFCRVGYRYHDREFTAVIPARQTTTLYVDPGDTSVRMNKSSFDKGPEERDGDLVLAGLLLGGAALVTVVHVAHLRRRHARRIR
jgi:hypothetical protein